LISASVSAGELGRMSRLTTTLPLDRPLLRVRNCPAA